MIGHTLAPELISCRNSRIAKSEIICNVSVAMKELFAGLELSQSPNLHLSAVEHNDNIGIATVVDQSSPKVKGVAKRCVSIGLIDWQRVATNLEKGGNKLATILCIHVHAANPTTPTPLGDTHNTIQHQYLPDAQLALGPFLGFAGNANDPRPAFLGAPLKVGYLVLKPGQSFYLLCQQDLLSHQNQETV